MAGGETLSRLLDYKPNLVVKEKISETVCELRDTTIRLWRLTKNWGYVVAGTTQLTRNWKITH